MMVNNTHRNFWLLLCVLAGILILWYLSFGLLAGDGQLIMPLDDTYIHFQYARQLASGQPYIYNPGDAPTSGATSFLYSPLLALGYLLGFQGLSLGYWAVGIGALCYVISAAMIYMLVAEQTRCSRIIGGLIAIAFVANGPYLWAALSGMETLLFTLTILSTLYAYKQKQYPLALLFSAFSALARPEGAVIALSVLLATLWQMRRLRWAHTLPILAILTQPLVNWLVTGSVSAAGNQAKSHLYNVTKPPSERLEIVLDYFLRIWQEWLSGTSPVDGRYSSAILFILAMGGVLLAVRHGLRQKQITSGVLAFVWLLTISGGIATLETAFWHFKRYQLPIMALFFPLSGWMLLWIWQHGYRLLSVGLAMTIVIVNSWTLVTYARRYHDNIYVVTHQQVAMARWVDENLPSDARVGVHDVGVMRYIGNRATYDMVGLTTEGVAPAWRQGSGTLYDTMAYHALRPDYFAVYHDIQALPLLEQAGVFGEELARFVVPLPQNTVASATSTQIVSRPAWFIDPEPHLNVGDLASEAAFDYEWWQSESLGGFASVVRRLPLRGCIDEGCTVLDGARIITGGESFTLPEIGLGNTHKITLRVHAASYARLYVGCEHALDTYVIPAMPGFVLDIPLSYPAEERRFCIRVDGFYESMGYYFAEVYAETIAEPPDEPVAIFNGVSSQGELLLSSVQYQLQENFLQITAQWYNTGTIIDDGKLFVHIYNDLEAPPIAQIEQWFMGDTMPPANLPIGYLEESYELDIEHLPEGIYTLAIGIYDPNNGKRYTLTTGQDRLFLGTVEIRE